MSNTAGILYIVATPLGNLDDISTRAVRLLSGVELIAAEDTRHSARLLQHYAIPGPVTALHEHNERAKVPELIRQMQAGKSIALICDAGTPLVSDPGYHLVRAAQDAGITVSPVPGACAAIAALSAAGLPSDAFAFDGFPPSRRAARRAWFEARRSEPRTLIFYESPHRILASLPDMAEAFGGGREATLARELTKKFETIRRASLQELYDWVARNAEQTKGEFVIIVHGAEKPKSTAIDAEAERILRLLLAELPVKQAAALAARITGAKKSQLYKLALSGSPSRR